VAAIKKPRLDNGRYLRYIGYIMSGEFATWNGSLGLDF
jgi:hypothetical protein